MTARDFALRAVNTGFGYACAVAVAAVVTVAVQYTRVIVVDGEGWASFGAALADLPFVLFVGGFVTFVMALPGFLAVLGLSFATGWRHWAFFTIGGALDVFPACALYEAMSRPDYAEFGVMLFSEFPLICLPGGFLGGLTFWYSAGRRLGNPAISPAPSGS
jgi:hypothetical protein